MTREINQLAYRIGGAVPMFFNNSGPNPKAILRSLLLRQNPTRTEKEMIIANCLNMIKELTNETSQ
jgi:hypothetical protein